MPRKGSRKRRNAESIQQRKNISKRLKHATKLDIISASAPNATPLFVPPPATACTASTRVQPQQYVQLSVPNESNDNSKIVINNVQVVAEIITNHGRRYLDREMLSIHYLIHL